MSRSAVVLALLLVAAAARAAAPAGEGEALLASSRLADQERAVQIYEAQAAAHPESFEARAHAAQALTQVIAIRTNGNLPLVDGLQDSDANRAIWADLGKRALDHARAAARLQPDHPGAAALLASSYMFYASSLGILRSIVSGAGSEYQQHANRLIELDPKYDDALGATLLASLFLIAPWPVYDRDAALAHFERAAQIAPASVRNQYGLGVFWARDGNPAKARSYFERAASLPCTANTERLLCDFLHTTAKRELARLPAR